MDRGVDVRMDRGVDHGLDHGVECSMARGHDHAWFTAAWFTAAWVAAAWITAAWFTAAWRHPLRVRRGRTRTAAPWPCPDRHRRWPAPHASLLDIHARAHHGTRDHARSVASDHARSVASDHARSVASDHARSRGSRDHAPERNRPTLAAAGEPIRMG
jgi:hypothetical protein